MLTGIQYFCIAYRLLKSKPLVDYVHFHYSWKMNSLLTLKSSSVTALIDPTNGGTISHIGRSIDPATNVLAWYEWDTPEPMSIEYLENESETHWLSRYRGGWQFLTPNAGNECVYKGQRHSCHGESSILPWSVLSQSDNLVILEVRIFNSLHVRRKLEIDSTQAIFRAHTQITNTTQVEQEIVIVEHIAFQGSTDARIDAPEKSTWAFPKGFEEDGGEPMLWSESGKGRPDLRAPIESAYERLAFLHSGNEGWVKIVDKERGTGALLTWDKKIFPFLWYWQERFSPRFPFYNRAEMTGLEPASCYPDDALVGASQSGRSTFISAGQNIAFTTEVELI